jgi:nicotinamide riboside transporter PnuC
MPVTRVAAGVFLLVHAIITAAIWIPPQRGGDLRGWGRQASWLFANSRPAMITLGVVASVALGTAGGGVLADQGWWPAAALVGAGASMALIVATFTPWWSAAVAINLVVIYVAWSSVTSPPSGG